MFPVIEIRIAVIFCIIYFQFIEKFQEVKEATRLAASKPTTNGTATGTGVTPVTSANASPITARACVPPPRSTETLIPPSDATPLLDPPNSTNTSSVPMHNSTTNSPAAATVASNNAVPNAVTAGSAGDSNTLKASMTAHQRSQSLSGLQVLHCYLRHFMNVQSLSEAVC
jgi:hypothetical protein